MASVNISGAEILESLEKQLQHMLDCEQFIFDLHNHPSKPLNVEGLLDNYGQPASQWDKDRILAAVRFVAEYGPKADLVAQLRPVEAFLAELPRLRQAQKVVEGLGLVLRYQLHEPTREEHVEMHKAGKRTLRERLDSLTDFDDSE